ncbi:MAG TPA: hypothetical protein PKD90_01315 [Phnomibacter sp.]|nr:hypothetical protein [Phnomibacter sp.]
MLSFFNLRKYNTANLFVHHYLDVRQWYVQSFGILPNVLYVGNIDMNASYEYIAQACRHKVAEILQHNWFNHNTQEVLFNCTLFRLTGKRMIELSSNQCHILYPAQHYHWASQLAKAMAAFNMEPVADSTYTRVVGFARK